MKLPRVRFTVRRMMVAVAVVAIIFGLIVHSARRRQERLEATWIQSDWMERISLEKLRRCTQAGESFAASAFADNVKEYARRRREVEAALGYRPDALRYPLPAYLSEPIPTPPEP
jgi:hypothetical protein